MSDQKFFATVFAVIGGVCVLILGLMCFRIVPVGHVGVKTWLGKPYGSTVDAGISVVAPFSSMYRFDTRTQQLFEKADVPSKEGLVVTLDVSVLYRVLPDKARDILTGVGFNYVERVLDPEARSAMRDVSSRYEAKALYTEGRKLIENEVVTKLQQAMTPRGIVVEAVLLRSMELPKGLSDAIAAKLTAEQQSEQMKFVLQKESQEADRKTIEAKGIASFQAIVTQGISEPLLRWKGIEATEKLAASPNSKIVIVGGKDGLPIILGAQ